jgi:hypothetical protein
VPPVLGLLHEPLLLRGSVTVNVRTHARRGPFDGCSYMNAPGGTSSPPHQVTARDVDAGWDRDEPDQAGALRVEQIEFRTGTAN